MTRGRPPKPPVGLYTTIRITSKTHDRLMLLGKRHGLSLGEVADLLIQRTTLSDARKILDR